MKTGFVKYYLRALAAVVLFALSLPAMIAAWDSIATSMLGGCRDDRTGQVWRVDGMDGDNGSCVVEQPTPAALKWIRENLDQATVRADGVVEPVVYFGWQSAAPIPAPVARIAQLGMAGAIGLACAAIAYLLLPVAGTEEDDE